MMELTSTYILLQGLQYHAFIGVGEQEQAVGNDYVLDLRLGYPFAAAMKSDAVDDTLNYADVFNVVSEVMKQPWKDCKRVVCSIQAAGEYRLKVGEEESTDGRGL